eukprot:10220614-Alexandrium_andersonii.AAC.1
MRDNQCGSGASPWHKLPGQFKCLTRQGSARPDCVAGGTRRPAGHEMKTGCMSVVLEGKGTLRNGTPGAISTMAVEAWAGAEAAASEALGPCQEAG